MKPPRVGPVARRTALLFLLAALAAVEQPVGGAEDKAPVNKPSKKRIRRLPAHFGPVVTEKQREEIYRIQEEYQPKIAALEDQLKALKRERDEKIFAVLTKEQKKRVQEAAARGKRKSADKEPVKPIQEGQVPPPADLKPSE